MFENFWGHDHVTHALERMIEHDRIAQTLLFAGPEGVGKATLARRFAARLLGDPAKIEQDDLSLSSATSQKSLPRPRAMAGMDKKLLIKTRLLFACASGFGDVRAGWPAATDFHRAAMKAS